MFGENIMKKSALVMMGLLALSLLSCETANTETEEQVSTEEILKKRFKGLLAACEQCIPVQTPLSAPTRIAMHACTLTYTDPCANTELCCILLLSKACAPWL